jgi:hypothetical protein
VVAMMRAWMVVVLLAVGPAFLMAGAALVSARNMALFLIAGAAPLAPTRKEGT